MKFLTKTLSFLFLTGTSMLYSQFPVFDWVKQMYQPPCVYSAYGQSIFLDASGNIYSTGTFSGTIDFDPGPGVYNLSGSGGDIYISKLDQNGNFLWAKAMGSFSGAEYGQDIVLDNSNNIYVMGTFMYTVDFDPGPGTYNLTTTGAKDIFILKLDAGGNFVWANKMGGPSDDYGLSLAIDDLGHVNSVGRFNGTGDFDPGAGTFNLTSNGSWDIVVSELDASGNFVWAKQIGGAGLDQGTEICTDPSGNIFITGGFVSTVDFDPGVGIYNLTAAGGSTGAIFALKLDPNGNFAWAGQMSGTGSGGAGRSISLDDSGAVYFSGEFKGTVDFDPGLGTFNLTVPGGGLGFATGIFISKLSSAGNFVWTQQIGGTTINDFGSSVTINTRYPGELYLAGYYGGSFDFDPGPGSFILNTGSTATDGFVTKLTSSGNLEWVKSFGGPDADVIYSMDVDTTGNVYSTGYFRDSTDFDPGPDTVLLNAGGIFDIYVHKLKVCNATTNSISASDCYSYTSPSTHHVWNTSGIYIDTVANSMGCDSILTIDLTITSTSSILLIDQCDDYISPSGNYTWTSSGIYQDIIPNSQGCDSVITVNLTIYSNSSSSIQVTSCNNYISPSGNYTWNTSGIYTDTIANSTGCDSIITVDLTKIDCTGINSEESAHYKAYPIPANETIFIETEVDIENGMIEIETLFGQIIYSGKVSLSSNETYPINISHLAPGIYFIRIQDVYIRFVKS
jgi:hypothetical protein